jgi:hypothetical protein
MLSNDEVACNQEKNNEGLHARLNGLEQNQKQLWHTLGLLSHA